MRITHTLARGRLALALALLVGGTAFAAETLRDETRVLARTAGGAIEKLTVPELAVGETRAVPTDSGAGALVTRTADGLTIEVAGETFDVTLPDVAALAASGTGLVLEREIHKSIQPDDAATAAAEGGPHQHRVVVVRKHHGDAEGADAHDLALLDDPESLFAEAGEGKRVMVVRRVVREQIEN